MIELLSCLACHILFEDLPRLYWLVVICGPLFCNRCGSSYSFHGFFIFPASVSANYGESFSNIRPWSTNMLSVLHRMVPTPNQLQEKCLSLASLQVCWSSSFVVTEWWHLHAWHFHQVIGSIILSVRQRDEATWDDYSSRTPNYDIFVSQPLVSQQLSQSNVRLTGRRKLSLKNAHNPELNPPWSVHEQWRPLNITKFIWLLIW